MAGYYDELMGMQNAILDRSNRNLTDMQPFMLKAAGLRRNPATGKIEEIPGANDPFLQRFKTDQIARFKGEYKSPQMETGLLSWKDKLNAGGTQGNAEYDTNAAILREGINRGGLESGANMLAAREGLLSAIQARDVGKYANFGAADIQLLSRISGALSPYQLAMEQAQNERMQSDANRAGRRAGNMQIAGTVVAGTIVAVL